MLEKTTRLYGMLFEKWKLFHENQYALDVDFYDLYYLTLIC